MPESFVSHISVSDVNVKSNLVDEKKVTAELDTVNSIVNNLVSPATSYSSPFMYSQSKHRPETVQFKRELIKNYVAPASQETFTFK